MARIAVLGGGITGMAAAWQLAGSGHEVILFEGSDRLGGKLRSEQIAGVRVDVGAESVLARRPEAMELMDELGLDHQSPAMLPAQLWSRGELVPMPRGMLMGVPADPTALQEVLTDTEIERCQAEEPVQPGVDISVGDLVGEALGDAVVDRLVEPLLGGVYAGHARRLSALSCTPALFDAATLGQSLTEAAADVMSPARRPAPSGPVFAGYRGGLGSFVRDFAGRLTERVEVHINAPVTGLSTYGDGWMVQIGPVRAEQHHRVDAVILTVPATEAASLLREASGAHDERPLVQAAGALGAIDYASVGVVTFAFPASLSEMLGGATGFLVPPVDGRFIKASTFSSSKWPWLAQDAPELCFVRVSVGRADDHDTLRMDDAELIVRGLADLREALGGRGQVPAPVATHVQRWLDALPQYTVGHADRVADVRRSLATVGRPIQVAGAAYDGVGIPACIASARTATRQLLEILSTQTIHPEE